MKALLLLLALASAGRPAQPIPAASVQRLPQSQVVLTGDPAKPGDAGTYQDAGGVWRKTNSEFYFPLTANANNVGINGLQPITVGSPTFGASKGGIWGASITTSSGGYLSGTASIASALAALGSDWTIEAWCYPDGGNGSTRTLLSIMAAGVGLGAGFSKGNSNNLLDKAASGFNSGFFFSGVSDNAWNFVKLSSRSSPAFRAWSVNGINFNSQLAGSSLATATGIYIGKDVNGGSAWIGQFNGLRIKSGYDPSPLPTVDPVLIGGNRLPAEEVVRVP